MAATIYNNAKHMIATNDLDWVNDSIRAIFLGTGYTFDETHVTVDDLGANELSGTGYQREVLLNCSVTLDTPNNRVVFDADDPSWTAIDAGEIGGIVLYQHNTDDTDSNLILHDDENYPVITNGSDLTHQFHADGVFILRGPNVT